MTFVDNGDGTATLSGTPTVGRAPTRSPHRLQRGEPRRHPVLHADRGRPPTITSTDSTTFTVGPPARFTVTTTGTPTPPLSESGSLPSGVTFTDNGNGTARLAGTPGSGTAGTYPITITATNGVSPDATQSFTLTVDGRPVDHLGRHHHLHRGRRRILHRDHHRESDGGALGDRVPTRRGDLHRQRRRHGHAGGHSHGPGHLHRSPSRHQRSEPRRHPVLHPDRGRRSVITSADSATFTVASAGSFTVTSTGKPTAALSKRGTLPSGVTFSRQRQRHGHSLGHTATDRWQLPDHHHRHQRGEPGRHPVLHPDRRAAPAITSANTTTFTAGSAGSFTVTSTGNPAAALSETGPCRAGCPSSTTVTARARCPAPRPAGDLPDHHSGRQRGGPRPPSRSPSPWTPPGHHLGQLGDLPRGQARSFTPTATGFPAPTITESGALPSGVLHPRLAVGHAHRDRVLPHHLHGHQRGGSPATQSFTLTVAPARFHLGQRHDVRPEHARDLHGDRRRHADPHVTEFGNLPSGSPSPPRRRPGRHPVPERHLPDRLHRLERRGRATTQFFTLTIGGLQITTTSLPPLTEGTAYSVQLTSSGASRRSSGPRSAALPKGLELSKTGVLAGRSKRWPPATTPSRSRSPTPPRRPTRRRRKSFTLTINS